MCGFVVTLLLAASFVLAPQPESPLPALVSAGIALIMAALCAVGIWVVPAERVERAMVATCWTYVPGFAMLSVGSGPGPGDVMLCFIGFLPYTVAVLGRPRSSFAIAVLAAAAIAGVAAAQDLAWLPLHGSPALSAVFQLLLVGSMTFFGMTTSVVIGGALQGMAERERRFGELVEMAVDTYWELDAEGRFTVLRPISVAARGVSGAGYLGHRPWELSFLDRPGSDWSSFRSVVEQRKPFRGLVMRAFGAEAGKSRWLSASGAPSHDRKGQFCGYWGVARDITTEVNLSELHAASEASYRELFERLPASLLLYRAGAVVAANAAAINMLGYRDEESLKGSDPLADLEVRPRREAARVWLNRLESLGVGQILDPLSFELHSREGVQLFVCATAVGVGTTGGPTSLITIIDETARHRAESELRRSHALFAQLIQTSPDVITLSELDSGRYTMVNSRFTELLGLAEQEVIGRTGLELGIVSSPAVRSDVVERLGRDGGVAGATVDYIGKDGKSVRMLASATIVKTDVGSLLVVFARDITEVERNRLEREAIFDAATIGIAFTRGQRFSLANPAFEKMVGFAPRTLVGQPGRAVWPDDETYAGIESRYGPLLAQGLPVEFEFHLVRGDTNRRLHLLAKAVDPMRPTSSGTVWLCYDVTERHDAEQALVQARDAAEAASHAKSSFLANTSHELRTPLNGLIGLARLLQQPDLDANRRREYIDLIADSARNLGQIISDILDVSKVEAGKLDLEAVSFDLHQIVHALQSAYLPIALSRGMALTLRIAQDVPRYVIGDPVRVRQILSNYVGNAMKFSAGGTVDLALERARGERIRMSVSDTGPGIDAATCERIFQPFVQGDNSITRHYGGTGLGLSICRELAKLMGGTVGVESRPGHGSLFWAELPLAASGYCAPAPAFGALSGDRPPAAHVLVAEDNPVNMLICVALLNQHGMRVAEASNGRAAIEAVERAAAAGDPFDVVLMDVQMPVMCGYEATRILRDRWDAERLPILALTAAALVSEREQAMAVGMNGFLTKPIEPDRLMRALTAVLAER